MHPLAVFARADEAAVAENFHVVRQRGLCNVELLQEIAGAQFPAGKHLCDAHAIRIAERPAKERRFFWFHEMLRHIDIHLYDDNITHIDERQYVRSLFAPLLDFVAFLAFVDFVAKRGRVY